MKTKILIGLLSILLIGCAGLSLNLGDDQEVAIYTIETLAIPIGYYAAGNELLDTSLREVYSLAVEGKLTPEGVNKIIMAMNTDDPLQVIMIKRTIRLAELIGAKVEGGRIVDMSGLDPALIKAAADGYIEGFDTYKITHPGEFETS